MFIIPTTIEEVLDEFPYVEEWLTLISKLLNRKINKEKIEFYYSYGYFISPDGDREEYDRQMKLFYSMLPFEERFNFEIAKVRVNLTIRVDHFMLSNRLNKGDIPELIQKIVKEITKVKMTIEGEQHNNKVIIDSIPPIDRSIISYKVIRETLTGQKEYSDLDIDLILDKISKSGIESLTDDEKEFLDRKSKEF